MNTRNGKPTLGGRPHGKPTLGGRPHGKPTLGGRPHGKPTLGGRPHLPASPWTLYEAVLHRIPPVPIRENGYSGWL